MYCCVAASKHVQVTPFGSGVSRRVQLETGPNRTLLHARTLSRCGETVVPADADIDARAIAAMWVSMSNEIISLAGALTVDQSVRPLFGIALLTLSLWLVGAGLFKNIGRLQMND